MSGRALGVRMPRSGRADDLMGDLERRRRVDSPGNIHRNLCGL
jgi:hypothetical protein